MTLEKQEKLKPSTLVDQESDSQDVAERITLKVQDSLVTKSDENLASSIADNSATAAACMARAFEESSVPAQTSMSNPATDSGNRPANQLSESANATVPGISKKAFFLTILCCYLPVVLYLLFAMATRPGESSSQLVRFSPLILMSPFALLVPLQLRWREHVAGLAKSMNLQTAGRLPFSERYYSWLGFGIGPWVLLCIFLGTKIYKGLHSDGMLPTLSPVADIVLAIGTVALIIMGTTLPLLVSAVAYLKFFGAINASVKPKNIASIAPSPLLSSAIVSGGLLIPAMLLCWSCPPFNLLAVPLQIAGWWFSFKEIDKYADWVKTNRQ